MSLQALWVAFTTIVVREIRRFTRIWPQTLLPPAVTMTLYFIIFGNLIGSRIGVMGGFDYMQFIVPGLIMMSVITNSYSWWMVRCVNASDSTVTIEPVPSPRAMPPVT